MLTLNIPFTTPTINISLPNADLSNNIAQADRMSLNQAMDGTVYTYVKTNTLEHLTLTIQASRTLIDSVLSALETNGSDGWKVTDHEGRIWNAKVLTTPIQVSMNRHQVKASPCDEAGTFNLEFIGIRQ